MTQGMLIRIGWFILTLLALIGSIVVIYIFPNRSDLLLILGVFTLFCAIILAWLTIFPPEGLGKLDDKEILAPRRQSLTGLFVAAILILAIIVGMIAAVLYVPPSSTTLTSTTTITTPTSSPLQPEVLMGLLVVLGVAVLAVLMFIIAATFSRLQLTDKRQPMGLPPGSIRAFIALLLIMMWIILSTFLYRQVLTLDMNSDAQTVQATQSSRQLAQQLVTTMGTLVVAVAGFYFGTSAVKAARDAVGSSSPVIRGIDSSRGQKGTTIPVTIRGKNFRSPKTVQLVRGSETMEAEVTNSSDTEILCKFDLNKDPDGKWALVVVNEDGGMDRLDEAFEIYRADPFVFKIQSSPFAAGQEFSVVVQVRDKNGNTDTKFSGTATLEIGVNPSSGKLSGTVTAPVSNGEATFNGLKIDKAGVGYTLKAKANGLEGQSEPFNVN